MEAEDRALGLLGPAATAAALAALLCLLGTIVARGLRRRFAGGLVVCALVFALATYAYVGVSIECAFD